MNRSLKILHLSDLHIPAEYVEDRDFKTIKVNLLKDIEKQRNKYGDLDVAIFTGDFIDKGHVELFREKLDELINQILEIAKIPRGNVVFVPGNHDAERPTGMILDQIKKVRESCEITSNKDDVEYMCKRFEPFAQFCARFAEKTDAYETSYGVTDITLEEGDTYRFIRLNSSIATYDNNDYNNLFVTKVQLDNILTQMDDQVEPRVTFLVMHHPMDWLTYEERGLLEEYVTDATKFNVDIILNGHIHNGQVSLSSDLDTNIVTLVSGVGYSRIKRGTSVYPDTYRYAVYCVNPNENKLVGALRITNQKKVFGPDRTLYKKINNDGVLSMPLKIDYGLSIRQFTIPISTKIVISDEFIGALDSVINNLWKFEQQSKKSIDEIATKKGTKNKKIDSKDRIEVFLFDLCCTFKTLFFPYVNSKDIRVHMRHYIPDIDKHCVIMSLYGDKTKSESVSDMEWSGKNTLIYYSYVEKRALLASLNPDKAYRREGSRWDEFLTLAVSYTGYPNQDIPAMSFGVSFDWDKMDESIVNQITNTLYCLSYVGFERVMENILDYAGNKLKIKEYFSKVGGKYVSDKNADEIK